MWDAKQLAAWLICFRTLITANKMMILLITFSSTEAASSVLGSFGVHNSIGI